MAVRLTPVFMLTLVAMKLMRFEELEGYSGVLRTFVIRKINFYADAMIG